MAEHEVQVGDRAPAFTLPTGAGQPVSLKDFRGRRVVLYFYPKDDTPGCTKEACGFQATLAQFRDAGAVILGVSRDPEASHRRFAEKFGLTFSLLSDPDAAVCKAYGVYKRKTMYGRTSWGIVRTTFLIDDEGKIAALFPNVRVEGHVEQVLKALSAHGTP